MDCFLTPPVELTDTNTRMLIHDDRLLLTCASVNTKMMTVNVYILHKGIETSTVTRG